MSGDTPGPYLAVIALVVVAAVLTSVEAALSTFSRARAAELEHERRPGARGLVRLLDDAPRHLNVVLFVRMLAETAAVVLATVIVLDLLGSGQWTSVLFAVGG